MFEVRACGATECLFLDAGGADGPGPKLCEQAVDGAPLLVAGPAVVPLTQLVAAVLPVVAVTILDVPVKEQQQKKKKKLDGTNRKSEQYIHILWTVAFAAVYTLAKKEVFLAPLRKT